MAADPGIVATTPDRVGPVARATVAVTILGFAIVVGRVAMLKTAPPPQLADAVDAGISRSVEMARRGTIVDRRGRVLAASRRGWRAFVDPTECDDLQTVAVELAALIDADPVPIDRRIHERLAVRPDARYVRVVDHLEPWQADTIRQAGLDGVGLEPVLERENAQGVAAAPLLGAVGFDHEGLAGLEYRFEDRLKPSPGSLVYLRDRARNPLWVEPDGFLPGQDGSELALSIDLRIQRYVEQRLADAIAEHRAQGGRVLVVDPETGEILALHDALNPDYRLGVADERETSFGRPELRPVRCATDPYEPGSTFKPFVWAVATEMGKAALDDELPTPEGWGWRTPYGRVIHDDWYYGPSSWLNVLVKSMNTGMAMMAERLTHDEMRAIVARFGFGERTGCGIPGETVGVVQTREGWTDYTQSSVAMGHEIAVSTLQITRAFCSFARDGTMPMLRLTAVRDRSEPFRFQRRTIAPETAATVREALGRVMTEGTGRKAQSARWRLFGKSGTAELWNPERKQYDRDRYTSSFIAGAPLERPRVVVLCVIDDPDKRVGQERGEKSHTGGRCAGPIVRDIVEFTLEYLGVPEDQDPEVAATLTAAR